MRWFALGVGFAFLFLTAHAHAQSLVGAWQGTTGQQQFVLVINKSRNEPLTGQFYSGSDVGVNFASTITINGKDVSFNLDNDPGTFSGNLSADGKSIVGTWKTSRAARPQPLTLLLASGKDAWVIDPSPHKVQFVLVDKDTRLEVLDWGGSGPPLVFLAGLGNTAHVFDTFAPKFTSNHHVYAITRRGYGASSHPDPTDENYDADRLGDDVLAVIDTLKLDRPIIAGHSIAGEELSSIGTRYPEKVAGLIYLEAAYSYAVHFPNADGWTVDAIALRHKFGQLESSSGSDLRKAAQDILAILPDLQQSLEAFGTLIAEAPDAPPRPRPANAPPTVAGAITHNERAYTNIKPPALMIMAVPQKCQPATCDTPFGKALDAYNVVRADALQAAMPSARLVRLPRAEHYIFRSNEQDVLREMNAFMDDLKKTASGSLK